MKDERGQALVEFALAFMVFMVFIFGIVDVGRGIYQFNAASQAAREIARVTSVHPGTTLGNSAETQRVIDIQKGLVPYLVIDSIECIDATGAVETGVCNYATSSVRVNVRAPFKAVTPPFILLGTFDMAASSAAYIQ